MPWKRGQDGERPPGWILNLGALVVTALMAQGTPSRALAAELPLVVSVSVPPQAYFVERIGGERVEVHVLVPPGTSPATYEPSPRQMVALGRSRLYVEVGHPDFLFEQRHLETLLKGNTQVVTVDMAAGTGTFCQDEQGRELDGDPHIWLSPRLMRTAAANIAAELVRLDPEGAPYYRQNLESLLSDIERLDLELRQLLSGLQGRRFMVFHPAWSHFACEYGLRQMAIESGGKEPGPAQLVATIEEARREGIRVVFAQNEELDPLAHDWLENLRFSAERIAAALR